MKFGNLWTAFIALWLGLASEVYALEEATVYETIIDHIQDNVTCIGSDEPFWQRLRAVNPQDGYRVRYSKFGCELGVKGVIIVAPGRSESSVEYYETALDFMALGYGPIYVVDHRGQGLSPRLLPDLSKSHVEHFEDYITDFQAVVDGIQQDVAKFSEDPSPPLFFVSNSMGGAIGLGYVQMIGDDNPFVAAALAGPMIRVNYFSFVDRPLNWLNLKIYSETGALIQATWRCNVVGLWQTDRCTSYAASKTFGPYNPDTRHFEPDTERIMTHSRARYDLRSFLWDGIDWSAIATSEYTDEEMWAGPQLGGSTNGWVMATARFNRGMRKKKNLRKAQKMPIMILMGTRDLRGYRPYLASSGHKPDLSHAKSLCDRLNYISAWQGRYVCEFVAIEGAFHELFKESDTYREKTISTVDWFFSRF